MSSKSDNDNRSNQLNPNNAAYESSRSGNTPGGGGDDDADSYIAPTTSNYSPHETRPTEVHKTGQYGIGVVGLDGQARFFTFTLEASVSNFAWGADTTLTAILEIYFEFFAMRIREGFTRHLKNSPTLFCMFDGTTSCLPWHVPLDLDNPEVMREFLSKCRGDVKQGADPDKVIAQLRTVLHPPFEDWGSFKAQGNEASSSKFIYDERCRKAIVSRP